MGSVGWLRASRRHRGILCHPNDIFQGAYTITSSRGNFCRSRLLRWKTKHVNLVCDTLYSGVLLLASTVPVCFASTPYRGMRTSTISGLPVCKAGLLEGGKAKLSRRERSRPGLGADEDIPDVEALSYGKVLADPWGFQLLGNKNTSR